MEYTHSKIYDNEGNILKAGVIVIKEENQKMYCLLTYRKFQDDYSFPKGHIEENESPERTAVREVLEETGCKIKIVSKLEPFYYDYPESGRCKVFMFAGKLLAEGKGIEENETLVWVPVDEVVEKLTYANLKDLFIKYREKLCLR